MSIQNRGSASEVAEGGGRAAPEVAGPAAVADRW